MASISKGRDKHPVSAILFFKIILGKTLEDGKLKLPNSFTRKYGNGLPKQVFLKPPDGTEWRVCWTKHDDEILLEKGWKEFATYYSLGHGYLVLFQYKETSHLEVHIFDLSGLEIDYDEKVQILDEMPTSLNTKLKKSQVFSSPQPCKKLRTGTAEDARTSYNFQNLPQLDQINGSQSQGTNLEKSTFVSVKKELDEDISGVTQCPQVEQSNIVTEEFNRAETTFRSRNPSFMIVMKRSYANNYTLHVPSNFSEVYLKDKQGPTLVEVQVQDGRTWTISYSLGKFNSGWKRFASDNNLNVGDILIFELTDRKDLSFKVSISRAAQPPSCRVSQVEGDGINLLDPGRVEYVDSKADITIINRGRKEAQRTSMVIGTDSSSNEAMRKAVKFTSENPYFISSIKLSFQGTDRPRVPNVFIKNYLIENEKQVLTLRLGNKLWPVTLLSYSYLTSSKMSNGWSLFAKEAELQVGDVCIFELINRDDAVFDVHIFRCNN